MGIKQLASVLGLVVCLCGCVSIANAEKSIAVIPNASFEEAKGAAPAGWETHPWGGEAAFEYAESGHTGERSVCITSTKGADASWFVIVPVSPNARYRLSAWIRTENVQPSNGKGALLNLHGMDAAQTAALVGTNDWSQVSVEFDTDDADEIHINCLFGGWGLATGRAWYDDLQLELLSQASEGPASVIVDATKTGAPISKYIYGQFIEHLGRCIYGGIWAEMLEDRKFYDAVDAKESPWAAIGGKDAVEMIRENPYVGEQMPRIRLAADAPRGIAQKGLGLVEGKEYTGRIVLAAVGGGAADVSLVWGKEAADRQTVTVADLKPEFATYRFQFNAGATTDDARLEITAKGSGHLDIGTLSLMPADNIYGMRADTLALLKELNAPVYRWPGGNFVSGYNWKDGIGDPDKRPPRKNPAWLGIEHNDFGIDEYIVFCREINTEPLIVVNSGLGDVSMAIEELQYANAAADTPGGKLRAANGHPDPYGVKWWGIGNEMYGDWQLGHMPLEEYVKKHNTYAEAMRKIEPDIKLIGVGATGKWSETMLAGCADNMDLLSEHFYVGERKGLLSHVRQVPDAIRAKVEAHRQYHATIPALAGKSIPICMDEWNYWYGDHLYGELGTQYFLKDALGIAEGLHAYFRASDTVFMANYAQTVNVIGCIKTSKTAAALDTTALPLKLYRAQFGTIPVAVEGTTGRLDIMAAWTESRDAITVGVVNPTQDAQSLEMAFTGVTLAGTGTCWIITGPGPQACNVPGKTPEVTIQESAIEKLGSKVEVPPLSICLYRLAQVK